MQAIEPGWATSFYGMALSSDALLAAGTPLIDRSFDDVVDAHLRLNRPYLGGIDKTLSGFVIIGADGDTYTLLDARDAGQIWCQNRESGEVTLRYDGLADVLALRAATDDERRSVDEARRAKHVKQGRTVATAELCFRYQWLAWTLAIPLVRDGRAVPAIDELVRIGISRFRELFPDRDVLERTFRAELAELAGDPHLAIYWLLHTTVLSDDERRALVLLAVGASDHPLLRAFVRRFGALRRDGDVPVVPEFRSRRALAASYGAFELLPDELAVASLRALELSPATQSLRHALHVVAGLASGAVDETALRATLAHINETTTGTALLEAVLDKRAQEMSSRHADTLARLIAKSDDPWWAQLEALWHVHELAYDGPALVAATRRILVHDRYHRRTLQMAMRAAQIANQPIDAIYGDIGVADALLGPYGKLVEDPAGWQAVVTAMPLPPLRRALAWRVLQRAELNRPAFDLAVWAIDQVLGTNDPQRVLLVGHAIGKLDPDTQSRLIGHAAREIDGVDHPWLAVLLGLLDGPDVDDGVRELALRACTNSLLARIDAPHATRVAKALVTNLRLHPDRHVRAVASEQLQRFAHAGAEEYLLDALTEYAVRYAAVRGPGGVALDIGKTENDQLEAVVASLYAAVRNLGTPAARLALVERLFAERRSYAQMAAALAQIWDDALHREIMAQLVERCDARAAGCYAYTLRELVRQVPPVLDVTRAIIEWQGDNEITRGFLHYALIVGLLAALEAGDDDLVRRAHDAASWIADPPLEPDAFVQGRAWDNPLDDDVIAARVARAMSGPPAAVPTPAISVVAPAPTMNTQVEAPTPSVAAEIEKTTPAAAATKTKPAATRPAKPAATKPAKPAATKPAKPAATKPAKPAATKPAKPAATKPPKPAATKQPKPAATKQPKPKRKPGAATRKPTATKKPASRAKPATDKKRRTPAPTSPKRKR